MNKTRQSVVAVMAVTMLGLAPRMVHAGNPFGATAGKVVKPVVKFQKSAVRKANTELQITKVVMTKNGEATGDDPVGTGLTMRP